MNALVADRLGFTGEEDYLHHLNDLRKNGYFREGRNGGTYGKFGAQMRFDLAKGFPLLTTKRVFLKAIIVELLWFLRGDSNIKFLHDHGVTIWDEWADEHGELGPVYGVQWKSWPTTRFKLKGKTETGHLSMERETIDQIARVVESLKTQPYGRRHIVSAWNPAEVDDMALPPCHCLFQFFVADGKLSCQLYQRSADWFLGVPFNIASYSLLTLMMAQVVGLEPGEFVHTFGDYHLYGDHLDAADKQLAYYREHGVKDFPTMTLAKRATLEEFQVGDFTLSGYKPGPKIEAPVSK